MGRFPAPWVLCGQCRGHRILAEGVNGFGIAVLTGGFGNAASFGFLAVCNGHGLCGALSDCVRPYAVMIANAAHLVGLADFKFLHFCFPLSVCSLCLYITLRMCVIQLTEYTKIMCNSCGVLHLFCVQC